MMDLRHWYLEVTEEGPCLPGGFPDLVSYFILNSLWVLETQEAEDLDLFQPSFVVKNPQTPKKSLFPVVAR